MSEPRGDFYVVGVGASAGGLEALEQLFSHMPEGAGAAFVVVQHLSPDFESHLDQLLRRQTRIPVRRAEDGMRVEPNAIYLIPPKKEMIIAGGKLLLTDKDPQRGLTLPIDHFFRSLAQDARRHAIGIILSGTGSDGSRGVRDVREAGGLVICQDPATAKFDGMPRSALETGAVDLVLPPAAVPGALVKYIEKSMSVEMIKEEEELAAVSDHGMGVIFQLLRSSYGIDFTSYKPNTVARRVRRRLALGHSQDLEEYAERLRHDPAELNALYRDLLIGVTRFFRDREAYARLEAEAVPELLRRGAAEGGLRVWVAGCATGEEAYSLGILLHEQAQRAGLDFPVKIFATDVHRASLETASVGAYPEEALTEPTPERRARYFRKKADGYHVAKEVRQMIVFAPHNVLTDAPFTRLDLISCRNLLIYLRPMAQKKVLSLFHFGLRTGGYLFLGPSETPGDLADEFDPVDAHWKLYRKRRDVRLSMDLRLPAPAGAALPGRRPAGGGEPRADTDGSLLATYDLLLNRFMPTAILVDETFRLVHTFGGAERFLRLRGGRPSTNVLDMVDEDLRTALSGALHRAAKELAPVRYTGIPVRAGAAVEQYRLVVEPFHEPRGNVTRLLILLENLGPSPESPGREEAVDIAKLSREHIGALESELRFTKENLQATVEELETSNEELQATNEELVASNEELQSTNEELHSVNEELYTVNAEYQRKIEELTELTEDMENLLASTRLGVLFLDRGLCVRKFTPGIAEVFNLLPQDVGRRVDGFAHTISHPGLLADVRRVLETEEPVQREVKDRSGADLLLRVLPYRSKGRCGGVVLTLVDISALKREQEKVRLLSAIVESSEDAIVGTDLRGVVATWNRGAAGMFGYAADEAVGRPLSELVVPPELREEFEALHARVRTGERIEQVLTRRRRKDGSPVEVSLGLSPIRDERGEVIGVSSIERDVTALRRAQETLAEREEHIRLLLESTAEAVYGMDLDGRCTFCNPAGVRMLGYRSAEEIVGREMHPLVHHSRPDGRPYPRDECPVYRILRDGAPVHAEEYFWRADGTCFPAEYWAHPVRRGGEMVGAVVTFLDVTERKRAEAELTAAREAAEAASRAKSEFLANMSHEIRTPMTAILGYADVLLSHLNNPDNVECVRRVKRNAHHLLEIINDILDLSKIEAGKLRVEPRPCSPQEVVADVLSLMEIRAREKDIALSAEFDGELPEAVETDPTRLRQILINLVGNAVKFTERGEVRLGVRYLPGPGRPRLEFAVTDTGVGMTPDQLSQLFRPFTQAHPAGRRFGGTGLGLTISQRLASMLGGTISARSEPGKGSTFTLVVDAGEVAGARLVRPAGARPRPEEPRPAPARLGGRVLVADDRRDIRYLAQYFLEEAGAEVTTAENGRAALDAVRRAAEAGRPFSAVVLDIQMPEMDGYEAARRLRAEGFAGAVIALTAAAMPGDREKCLRAGCDEYLCKPVERDRLVEAIARCTRTETAGDRVSGAARGRASVLIVEDNRDASGALAKLLTMQGYEVRTAADARSGIEAARQLRPDVVLMDIGLPDMSGLEAVRRIKSLPEADGVLCVALTGYSDEEARKQILAAGFDHLALKPIDFEALLRFLSARRERG